MEAQAIISDIAIRYVCSECGAPAGCNCRAPAITRAEYALLKNPEKSNVAIAKEIGVGHVTVKRARDKLTFPSGKVEKRVGRDGKVRRLPVKRATLPPESDDEPIEAEISPANFRNAFFLRAEQAIRMAAYSGRIRKDIIARARQVARAWNQLADNLEQELSK